MQLPEWYNTMLRDNVGQAVVGCGLSMMIFIALSVVFLGIITLRSKPRRRGDGKRVVLTGAASGIGRATCLELWELGYEVIACDVDEKRLASLSEEVDMMGQVMGGFVHNKMLGQVLTVVLDVASVDSRAELYAGLKGKTLDAVVSVAEIIQTQPQATLSEAELERIMHVDALGPMQLVNSLIPLMLKEYNNGGPGGSVCLVSSMSARDVWPGTGAYPATKHALVGFGDSLRREAMANDLPLRVSMVEPGAVATSLQGGLIQRQLAWVDANSQSPWSIAIGRSARYIQKFGNKGLKMDWMSVTPEAVAKTIALAIGDDTPSARYTVATFVFHIMFRLTHYLPIWLGDKLLMAIA